MKRFVTSALMAVIGLNAVGEVRLKGVLGKRLDALIDNYVAATDVDYITACFPEKTERRRWWQTEFWGKYMHSAVPYAAYSESRRLDAAIEKSVDRILSSQEPNGYIGNYPDELRCGEGWDVWGIKYTMMGLLHYAQHDKGSANLQKREQAVTACKRLCDYVIAEIGPKGRSGRELWQTGNWSGYASSSILEPVARLYRHTRDEKYLDFADYIVEGMTKPESGPRLIDLALDGVSVADRNGYGNKAETHGGYVMKHNRWKAYEMMSCYQGLLEYAEEKGMRPGNTELVDRIRRAAIMTAEDIVKEEVNLAGGCACSEAWFHGARKQHLPYKRLQETCVTTTWMRLCEKILDLTDDPAWADQIERTFYNAYLAALKPDGSEIAGYTPLSGYRFHGQHHCAMHVDCCSANGPRGFLCFLQNLFSCRRDLPTFNFYASASVRENMSDGKIVAFDMYSLYPRSESVRIVSHTEGVGVLPVRFRIPGRCANAEIKLNGVRLGANRAGSYYTISHAWRLGDIVELSFKMPVVAHTCSDYIAFTRGPILLARDSRFADGDFMEPLRRRFQDGEVVASFVPVHVPLDDFWMTFAAELPIGAHHENPEGVYPAVVRFCDYASAGNRWEQGNYYRTWFPVELQPTE